MISTISKPDNRDLFLMALTAFIWASAFIAIKVVVVETGPLWLAAWRVLIGFVVLLPYAIWRGWIWPGSPRMWLLIAIASLFNVVFPFFLISWAQQTIDAGVASLLMGTGPFLALIGSHIFTSDDHITWPKALAVLLGFSGVLTIVGVDALSGLGGNHTTAQLAAVGGALCYTIAGLMVRRIDMPPVRLGCIVFGIGATVLIMAALFVDGLPRTNLSSNVFWALLYLGLFPTALGQILRFTLIRRVGYAAFALALNLIPVIGVVLGALLLGEVITLRTAIALALVLSGLFIARINPKKATP